MRKWWAYTAIVLLLICGNAHVAAKKKRPKKKRADAITSEAFRHHQAGVMAHVQGDSKGAVAAFHRAIAAKPDFAYAYYRLGFVMEEERRRLGGSASDDDALPILRSAIALDPSDEMAHIALGQALQERERHDDAAAVYEGITASVNPRSAQAYWSLGKMRAVGRDEWESDPDDPRDPSHCYEQAARLNPTEYHADGTRTKRVEPMTPEREEREEREAKERRERVLGELREGKRTLDVGDGERFDVLTVDSTAGAA
jgi:tetratricopeptide (TPR) repeat protein